MLFEVYVWETKASLLPEIDQEPIEAEGRLSAAIEVMRKFSMKWAHHVCVYLPGGRDPVLERYKFVAPEERE